MKYYTLNARDNIYWDVMTNGYRNSSRELYESIRYLFDHTFAMFNGNHVKYDDLKNVLTPQKQKKEIGFVFDSQKINSMFYGKVILEYFEQTFKRINKAAVFYGDLVGANRKQVQKNIRLAMIRELQIIGELTFINSTQYFVVYITNMSEHDLGQTLADLSHINSFVGWGDFSFCSYLKMAISISIPQQFLLCNKHVIFSAVEDFENKPDHLLFDFAKHGFKWIGVDECGYLTFLSYKIKRGYYEMDRGDQIVAIGAITQSCELINDYDIIIDDAKFKYLLDNKEGSLKLLTGGNLNKEHLISQIKNNINLNYLFNLEVNEYMCNKFCTDIECYNTISMTKFRGVCFFEVIREAKQIRLITLY